VPRPAFRLPLVTLLVLLPVGASRAAGTLLLPMVDAPSGAGGSVVLEPVKQRAQPTRRLVYSCVTPGHVTSSDRPCGPQSAVQELKIAAPAPVPDGAVPDLPEVRQAAQPNERPAPARHNAGADAAADEHATTCRKLQATLDDVDSHMRAGYSAREAGRLWQRWRDAKAGLHEAKC
jgi:hypothetical protein